MNRPLESKISGTATRRPRSPATPAAVIDIGANAVRMAIGQIDEEGHVQILETLSQEVELGRDAFAHGRIEPGTIEDCVRVLQRYRRLLGEYQIVAEDRIRVVATSAVREAENRLAFVDRVAIATGFQVELIDDAEVSRITYLGIQPFLKNDPRLAEAKTVITEVGGGNTEMLVVQGEDVVFSRTYKLGSLRLLQTLSAYRAPAMKVRRIMEAQIRITVEEVMQHVATDSAIEMITLGGDVRFAAAHLLPDWKPEQLNVVPVKDLERLADQMLDTSPGKLVQEYHLTFPDAETIAPALLTYVKLAQAFRLDHVLVTNVNLRDGLLRQMTRFAGWTQELKNQIIRSAIDLGRKYEFNEPHSRHVADLARKLFDALRDEHRLDDDYDLTLQLAALLHEIGMYVNIASQHKHSMYLILNSEIFGMSYRDVLLVALVARYSRRASPKPNHEVYTTLTRERRIVVAKLAAILRVADALDCSRSQRIRELRCSRENGRLVISIPQVEDLSLEQLAIDQKGPLFEEVFGMQVFLRPIKK